MKKWVANWVLGRPFDMKDRSSREQLFPFVFTLEFGGIQRRAHPRSRTLQNQSSSLLTPLRDAMHKQGVRLLHVTAAKWRRIANDQAENSSSERLSNDYSH